MKHNLLYRLPVIIYCIVIFVQSSFPSPEYLPGFELADKLMHLGGYALLGGLVIRALKRENTGFNKGSLIVLAVFVSTLYGLSDEIYQSFVSERTGDIMDVAADAAGSCIGAIFFWRDLPYVDT